MLASMSLTEYRGWVKDVQSHGFFDHNHQLLLQELNASVYNASGRVRQSLSAADFALAGRKAAAPEPISQTAVTELLSQQASR